MEDTWPVWRVFPCYGGWYWEVYAGKQKVNGGLAPNEAAARITGMNTASAARSARYRVRYGRDLESIIRVM